MEYTTVIIYDPDKESVDYRLVEQGRYPVDIDRLQRVRTRRVVITTRSGYGRSRRPVVDKSPRQDATSADKAGQGPKTRGGTNEFIRAFWVNGKPKCRTGYRYDFNKKMCRLIK